MSEVDVYVYCIDNSIFDDLKNKIQIPGKKCNLFQIRNYHSSPIKGLITENIFFGVYDNKYHCRMVSQNIKNPKPVFGIVITPESQKVESSLQNFVCLNLHNSDYMKEILGNSYCEIFDHSKMTWSNRELKQKINGNASLLNIERNYEEFQKCLLPFPNVTINVEKIDEFFKNFNEQSYNDIVEEFNKKRQEQNLEMKEDDSIQESEEPVRYLSYASIGMGDFIQRFERLYKLLNFSDVTFKPCKDSKLSYKNECHGSGEYLTMYDFPGYDFIEKIENVDEKKVMKVSFQNLFEIFMYNKNYFKTWDRNKILFVNLGSYIVGINNRPYVGKMFNWTNDQKVIKECPVPYTIPEWELEWKSENKLIILHFRRGDYVNQFLSNIKNPRTMSSFQHILKNIKAKEEVLDAVIISDHFDMSKIPEHKKMCIPIFFDYDSYEINSTIPFGNNQKLIIRDKVLGVDGNSNLKSLKYISKCDYHIGNMSCFPVIIGKIFNKKKIVHMQCQPDIKNWGDVIVREPTVP